MNKHAKTAGRAGKPETEQVAGKRWRARISVTAAVALAIAGATIVAIVQVGHSAPPAAVPRSASSDGAGLVVGSGPVTVELYSDFLCPACKAFEADAGDEIGRLLAAGRIRLVYRPVAILDRASGNRYSTRAAASAACAADAGKLMPYVKVLFRNQPPEYAAGPDDEQLIRLARTAGITGPEFAACVRDGRYQPWVRQVTATMEPRDVPGTPTVIVNGKPLEQATGQQLLAAVNSAGAR